jgi:hypothetical protein
MRSRVLVQLSVVVAVVISLALAQGKKPLTNDDVLQMVKAGFQESMIIKTIEANDANYDVSVQALMALKKAGVSQPVIEAMLAAEARKRVPPAPSVPVKDPAVGSAAPADPSIAKLLLKEETEIALKFAADLSSKTAAEGDPVDMILDEDLKVGDVVVVRKGAHAVATVTNVKKAGMMGKPGELNIRLEYLKAGDARVRVRGSKGKEGQGKVGTTVALTVLFGPIGLIKHGKNVEVKAGTPLKVYADQDIWLPPAT